jgi:hypothetical protein
MVTLGWREEKFFFIRFKSLQRDITRLPEEFFYDLPEWKRGLDEYELDVQFIWITLGTATMKEIPENFKRLCGREITVNPKYTSMTIQLSEVNKGLWQGFIETISGLKRVMEQGASAAPAKKRRETESATSYEAYVARYNIYLIITNLGPI